MMLRGLTEDEGLRLFERIGATAIANQAILKCTIAGFPLTVDNTIMFVGDFVDPENAAAAQLIELIGTAIEEVIDCRNMFEKLETVVGSS